MALRQADDAIADDAQTPPPPGIATPKPHRDAAALAASAHHRRQRDQCEGDAVKRLGKPVMGLGKELVADALG